MLDSLPHAIYLHTPRDSCNTIFVHRIQTCVNCMTLQYIFCTAKLLTCGCRPFQQFFSAAHPPTGDTGSKLYNSWWGSHKLPGNLLEMELAPWFARLWSITILFPHVHFVGCFLIIKRWLQMIHHHFLVEHWRQGWWHWRYNPYPISRTTIPNETHQMNAHKFPAKFQCYWLAGS